MPGHFLLCGITPDFEEKLAESLNADICYANHTPIIASDACYLYALICRCFFLALPPNLSYIPQTCSLIPPTHGTSFSLSWNPDPQNSADVYHIQVFPEPSSSCPSVVGPMDSYNCSGLHVGEQYTVSVNASNCNGTQQSTTAFSIQLEGMYYCM